MEVIYIAAITLTIICSQSTKITGIGQMPASEGALALHAICNYGSLLVGIALLIIGFVQFTWWIPIVAMVGGSFLTGFAQATVPILREFSWLSLFALIGGVLGGIVVLGRWN